VAISGLLLLSALFNNSRSPRKHSGKRADQRTCSGREVLGGNGVGWRPARDHAYFLTLIAPLADCHSDFCDRPNAATAANVGLRAYGAATTLSHALYLRPVVRNGHFGIVTVEGKVINGTSRAGRNESVSAWKVCHTRQSPPETT
jgi:hypothetical protein